MGIPVGVYFYSYAKNKEQALKDAQWIYEQIKDYKVELGVAFDWENWSFYNDFGLSFYELTDMATSHLNYFREKGYNALLYSSYAGDYMYWQACSDGRVSGINGAVDINIRYKN